MAKNESNVTFEFEIDNREKKKKSVGDILATWVLGTVFVGLLSSVGIFLIVQLWAAILSEY